MRKALSIIIFLIPFLVSAQVQNGYVRTIGTSTNRYGSPIAQVKVNIKGLNNSFITAANGTFSFNLGGGKKQYSVASVTKAGYSLYSVLQPFYNVGDARVEIVMQSREERLAEKARITKQAEAEMAKNYESEMAKQQSEIDSLRKALAYEKQNSGALKEQIYIREKQIVALDSQYQVRSSLIDKMVDKYVNIDYATITELQVMFCAFVENGELERADSLLNTIDIETTENEKLNYEKLSKEKTDTSCFYWQGKHDMAVLRMQLDTALYCLERCAQVDPQNIKYQMDVAQFIRQWTAPENYTMWAKANKYAERALLLAQLEENAKEQLADCYELAIKCRKGAMRGSISSDYQQQLQTLTEYAKKLVDIRTDLGTVSIDDYILLGERLSDKEATNIIRSYIDTLPDSKWLQKVSGLTFLVWTEGNPRISNLDDALQLLRAHIPDDSLITTRQEFDALYNIYDGYAGCCSHISDDDYFNYRISSISLKDTYSHKHSNIAIKASEYDIAIDACLKLKNYKQLKEFCLHQLKYKDVDMWKQLGTLCNLITAYTNLEDYSNAEYYFKLGMYKISLQPRAEYSYCGDLYNVYASLLYKQGKYQEAIKVCEKQMHDYGDYDDRYKNAAALKNECLKKSKH